MRHTREEIVNYSVPVELTIYSMSSLRLPMHSEWMRVTAEQRTRLFRDDEYDETVHLVSVVRKSGAAGGGYGYLSVTSTFIFTGYVYRINSQGI